MTCGSARNGVHERGSALLIIFLMAAIIAVALYAETPSIAFEAQREKEQQLIDRGSEYAGAVRLYVRRLGSYPPSVEALENTNNLRFLRHRFKDPFTGKDDWRLLHTVGGGVVSDSKVKQPLFATGENPHSLASDISSADSSSGAPEVQVLPVRTRGPAIPAHNPASENGGERTDGASDLLPTTSLLPTVSAESVIKGQAEPGEASSNQSAAAAAELLAATGPALVGGPGGGIAGVASRASGHAVKIYNDQSDYSLWEFFYDPRKDPMRMFQIMQQNLLRDGSSLHDPSNNGAPGFGQAPPSSPKVGGFSAK